MPGGDCPIGHSSPVHDQPGEGSYPGGELGEMWGDEISYYLNHGPVTDPGPYGRDLKRLPGDIRQACAIVQGLVVHVSWAERYGLGLDEERKREVNLCPVRDMVGRVLEIDPGPLHVARPPERRLVGNCRHFAVLLTAVLRSRGVPARARCGFASYFNPGWFEDHWITEYFDRCAGRWVKIDPQLDEFQVRWLDLTFDPCDLPDDQFITAGQAREMCSSGKEDGDMFGIFDLRGSWFIDGNVIRDALSLCRIELLPWDMWGPMPGPGRSLPAEDEDLLVRLSRFTQCGHPGPILHLLATDSRLKPPSWWTDRRF